MKISSAQLLCLCFVSCFIAFVIGASSTDSDLQTSLDISRQVRKTEISRALRLLKKHSIVGKNAKIVLKNSGKHLLIDGSEKLSLIQDGQTTPRMESSTQKTFSQKSQSISESMPESTNKSRKRSNSKGKNKRNRRL